MIAAALLLAGLAPLRTVAEATNDEKTGRYTEVIALCGEFERAFPGKARCARFGTTPEGRPMLAIVASADGTLDPETARKRGRPSILIQGGIHAGEIDGKDAGLRAMREVLAGREAKGALAAATVVFVPVFNVDGHERVSKWNRSNQRGPEEMGWRATAQNLNLNRDYAKADAPEMRAMLALLQAWDPVVYMDLHVTDGAKFRHDVSITADPAELPEPSPLRDLARQVRDEVIADLTAEGHLPLRFYPAFVKDDDPTSGFAVGVAPPRFSTGYWAVRDRVGLLVETHSWKTYRERVKATYDAIVSVLARASTEVSRWRQAEDASRAEALDLGGKDLAVTFVPGETRETIDFLGYAYRREPSKVSGGTAIAYDESMPETWKVPLVTATKGSVVVHVPKAGYVVPAAYAARVGQALALHGIRTQPVAKAREDVEVEVFRAGETKLAAASFEGRQQVTVKGAWTREKRDVPAGSIFVPVRQPQARLLVHLLEPQAPDSLVSWGSLTTVFEQKEYVEPYVLEEIGARMLAEDPAVRAEFDRALQDPAFAADAKRRLDFFYERSPYRDPFLGLVPVYRVDAW